MTQAFVGFIVVALVGGAAEMASAFSGARKNRLDLSVGIALGSAAQIALFVAPVLVLASYVIGPSPMNLQFWPGAVVMMLIATLTATLICQYRTRGVVQRRAGPIGLSDIRHDALLVAAESAVTGGLPCGRSSCTSQAAQALHEGRVRRPRLRQGTPLRGGEILSRSDYQRAAAAMNSARQRASRGPVLRLRPGVPRFLLLLLAALVFLVVTPLLGSGYLGVMTGKGLLTVMLLIAVAELRRSAFGVGLTLALAAIAADWLDTFVFPSAMLTSAITIRVLFFLYVVCVTLHAVLRQRTVTLDTIAGASCVYLFIGFMWAMLFALLDQLEPGSIRFPESWTQGSAAGGTARYVYFSFVTLTTLGYGDIVPNTVDASGLVVAEAVIGQLYLTVLVARLVGLHLRPSGVNDRRNPMTATDGSTGEERR